MYETPDDPYCYAGTDVLINKLGIRNLAALTAFEAEISRERASENLPGGRLGVSHFRAVHRHLFQDVYSWAGHLRTVRISRDGSAFCYPEYIARELDRIFRDLREERHLRGRTQENFATGAAHFLAELNAIHAFRDGNGRAQLGFLALLAVRAGHPLGLDHLDPVSFLAAMIASFHGKEHALAEQILKLTIVD